MGFEHPQLANMLEWKFGSHPQFGKGISTKNGQLVDFAQELGSRPTDAELTQWMQQYLALPAEARDPVAKELARKRSKLAAMTTVAGLKQFILEELLPSA